MRKHNKAKQQRGFFDLGFSMAVLALTGTLAYSATPEQDEKVAVEDPQIEVITGLETANTNVDIYQ
ncbi:MAG: hypothetical protein JSU67_10795 [Gammaproteobacteria bacterium]|nr:MAG: hypothetical protein EP300_01760 [Gammaproteobacteria bacterium]UCH38654.1 MAG: hypothetical protein JSU67_10795 [Gammaproteobacteria bacterium]